MAFKVLFNNQETIYEKPISISLTRKPDSTSVSYSAGNVNAKSGGLLLMRQPKSKPSMSDAAVLLKKNEWSLILWRKGLLTDEQVSLIAWSSEKVLDLSLFELTDHQLEILARYCWEEIIFWLKTTWRVFISADKEGIATIFVVLLPPNLKLLVSFIAPLDWTWMTPPIFVQFVGAV